MLFRGSQEAERLFIEKSLENHTKKSKKSYVSDEKLLDLLQSRRKSRLKICIFSQDFEATFQATFSEKS